jgi:hypothetical protein
MMNDKARRLRAQKSFSTDPAYLERMARQEETQIDSTSDAAAQGESAHPRRAADAANGRMP